MTLTSFKESLAADKPENLGAELESLWWDAKGNWNAAHSTIQDAKGKTAAWIHAYLHRKEGDPGNARYWYNLAGREPFSASFDEEWEAIASRLLMS